MELSDRDRWGFPWTSETPEEQLDRFRQMARTHLRQRFGYGKGYGSAWSMMVPEVRRLALRAIATETVLYWSPESTVTLPRVQEVLTAICRALPDEELDRP